MQDYNRSISFTSRCPQIRQAEWICHAVNTKLPYRSSSKLNPIIFKFQDRNKTFIDMFDKLSVIERATFMQSCTPEEKKIILTDRAIINFNTKIRMLRDHVRNIKSLMSEPVVKKIDALGRKIFDTSSLEEKKARAVLNQLKNFHLGNCSETAQVSEIVLKMNGVENAYNAGLLYDHQIVDHRICLYNIDGSEFSGINNKTVIVDPWAGFADFANNAFNKYKTIFKDYLGLDRYIKLDGGKFKIYQLMKYDLNEKSIEGLKKSYPELVHKKGGSI